MVKKVIFDAIRYNRQVRILAVDTCFKAGGVASLENGEVIRSVFSKGDEPYSSRLFKDLAALEFETGLSPKDYDLFAVANGPGSFTGVRAGITAVKAWGELFAKPIVEVSSLEAVAEQTFEEGSSLTQTDDTFLICALLDAHRGQVFGGIYEAKPGPDMVTPPTNRFEGVLALPELVSHLRQEASNRLVTFASPDAELLGRTVAAWEFPSANVSRTSDELSPWVGRIAYRRALAGTVTNPLLADANYIRRCDAEVYWKGE